MDEIISLFPSRDIFVISAYAVLLALHLLFVKKTRLVINLAALYASFALVIAAPRLNETARAWLEGHSAFQALVFLGVFAVLYIALSHSNLLQMSQRVAPGNFATSLVYRISVVGLLLTTVLYFTPPEFREPFGALAAALFINRIALIVWFVLPLFLAFSYRFKTERGWIA